ncbi:SET domain-containing protein [Ectobacillus ponti]|uniref:SET domain-containing protein n=1 Tax=Ectobacillus ponti TaxID=2961894 RepID=A0AA42BN70_9BACI|nr:SET domain-containing protein [Ectobacillus ponti]
MIYVKQTEQYGRGVFAARAIQKGEYLEEAPVLIIPEEEWANMRDSILTNYVFRWGADKAIALGYGSLYNHSYTPNAGYITDRKKGCISFYARRDIAKDEEIRVNYNGDSRDQSPLWFEVLE